MLGGGISIVLGILLVSLSGILGDCLYAKFSPEHTACLPPNPTCDIIRRGVTDQDKEHIVKLHNQYRSKIATGQETRGGGMPQATSMLELSWDAELAAIAQLHAEQCEVEHECNRCRQVERFPVGQNLFYCGDSLLPTGFDWDSIMTVFYDEVSYFKTQYMKPYYFEESYAHFTQLVWDTSRYIGCGSIVANASGFYNSIYVCNFGPAGNGIGGEMYKVGETCSACSANSSSCTVSGQGSYEGLCPASSIPESAYTPTTTTATSTASTPANNKKTTQRSSIVPAEVVSEEPGKIGGAATPANNGDKIQQNNIVPAEVVSEEPGKMDGAVTPLNNGDKIQLNNIVPAEVISEEPGKIGGAATPANNGDKIQLNNIVPAEVVSEEPGKINGAVTPSNNGDKIQLNNILAVEGFSEEPVKIDGASVLANNEEIIQQNNTVPIEVISRTDYLIDEALFHENNEETNQQNNVVSAEVNSDKASAFSDNGETILSNIVWTDVVSQVPVLIDELLDTINIGEIIRQSSIVPAEMVYEAPVLIDETPTLAYNEETIQQNNIASADYETPVQFIYDTPALANYEETIQPDDIVLPIGQLNYESPGQVGYEIEYEYID